MSRCLTPGCIKPGVNHPECTVFDDEIDDYRDHANPAFEPPKATDLATARRTVATVAAQTAPNTRVADLEAPVPAPSGRWSDAERAAVLAAVRRVCERHAGGGEFTSDEVWAELGATVRKTPGLTSVLREAQHLEWLDSTGKKGRSQRARTDHDDGRELTLWYSLLPRKTSLAPR